MRIMRLAAALAAALALAASPLAAQAATAPHRSPLAGHVFRSDICGVTQTLRDPADVMLVLKLIAFDKVTRTVQECPGFTTGTVVLRELTRTGRAPASGLVSLRRIGRHWLWGVFTHSGRVRIASFRYQPPALPAG